jgi:hypothetical protein
MYKSLEDKLSFKKMPIPLEAYLRYDCGANCNKQIPKNPNYNYSTGK